MKYIKLFIATIIFLILDNTITYWGAKLGRFSMIGFLGLIIFFLALTSTFFIQIINAIKERFIDKQRLMLIVFIGFSLTSTYLFPTGLFNLGRNENDSLLIATREGATNCRTTLKLYGDGTFMERNICFEVNEITGTYQFIHDTIFFKNLSFSRGKSEFYKFAVFQEHKLQFKNVIRDIVRFENDSDTVGTELWIIKNELSK